MQIADRCFLITGGGSGLGAASARMLVDAGARVVLADVNAEAGQQTAAALGEAARFVNCDVTREEDGKAAVTAARQHGGRRGWRAAIKHPSGYCATNAAWKNFD